MAILSVNDDVTIPGVVVCVHVETILKPHATLPDKWYHEFRCWSAVAGRIEGEQWTREKQKHSSSAPDFWDWLNYVRQPQRPEWLFLHNLPTGLTALGLWSLMGLEQFSLHLRPSREMIRRRQFHKSKDPQKVIPGMLITSSPPDAVVCYQKSGWKLICLGCENYWASTSAASVADTSAIMIPAPSPTAPLANWLAYSVERSQHLSRKVTKLLCWHRRQELGRFGFSVSGIALAGFRHRFMDCDIHCPDEQDDRDREREAYYPGRVEAFWRGTLDEHGFTPLGARERARQLPFEAPALPLFHLDARSFYGAVGSAVAVPVECIGAETNASDSGPPASGRMVEYLAGVEIATRDDVYPLRHSGRVLYARGHYRTVLAGPELSRAHQRGHVVRWLWWRRYRLEPALKAFSDAMWAERVSLEQKGESDLAAICKSLLARLHGKFLQRKTRWEARPAMRAPKPWAQWSEGSLTDGIFRKFRAIGWDVEEEVDAGDAPHCFPALAAWITSWGREWLLHWMKIAGKENVLYVATDSLVVTTAGAENLTSEGIIWPDGIGSLRVEEKLGRVSISGANNATLGARCIRSGRRASVDGTGPCDGIPLESDSLKVILHARSGQHVEVRRQPWTDHGPRLIQEELPGGWLAPPVVNECFEPFRSTNGQPQNSGCAAR